MLVSLGGASAASASTAYVIGSGNGADISTGVIPIDLGTDKAQPIVTGAPYPVTALAASPDQTTVYVGAGSSFMPIDVATNTAGAEVPATGGLTGLAVSPDGGTVYETAGSALIPYDVAHGGTAGTPIPLPGTAVVNGIVLTPNGTKAYVLVGSSIVPVDLVNKVAKTAIPLPDLGSAIAMSPTGTTVFAGSHAAASGVPGQVLPIAVATDTAGTPAVTSAQPTGLAVTQDGTRVYVALRETNQLAVVNPATSQLVGTPVDLGAGAAPNAIALAPNDRTVYLSYYTQDRLARYDIGASGTITAGAPVLLPFQTQSTAIVMTKTVDPNGTASPTVTRSVNTQSSVIGDPTNPTVTLTVGQNDKYGIPIPPSELTTSVTTSKPAIIVPAGVTVTGSGATRTVSFSPLSPGTSNVTITVNGRDGRSSSAQIGYAASKATTPTSRVLQGLSDASTAQDVGDGLELIGDDEFADIRLFDPSASGPPLQSIDIGLPPNDGGEFDFESSARLGDTIYWLGSHGNNKDGLIERNRHAVVATKVTGTGADTTLTRTGAYGGMRDDLIAWDRANGDRFGFQAANTPGAVPDGFNGFNIEGAEFAPGSSSTLYLGFRSPHIAVAGSTDRALIVPVTNIVRVLRGQDAHATFGDPILLDLGGMTIREIRKNKNDQYVIIGSNTNTDEALFSWTGRPADKPVRLTTVVPASTEAFDDGPGAWEGIAQVPDVLTAGSSLKLIMDQGYERLYVPSITTKNKSLTDPRQRKSRVDTFTLTGNVGAAAQATAPTFPAQPATTTGVGQWVTVTNSGAQDLVVTGVKVAASDRASAGDFLVGQETCTAAPVRVGQTCEALVRFSPARANATSTAGLVLSANVDGGSAVVPLTGTSTGLPSGETGPKGDTGSTGAKGDTGATGAKGDVGPKGDLGAMGPAGKDGARGPAGPKGETGLPGRDGTFSLTAKRATTSVRRGRSFTVAFVVHNATTAGVGRSTATASAPKALRLGGTRTLRVSSLAAGHRRSVSMHLKVGRTAEVGRHTLTVRLKVEGRTVTQKVAVRVTR
jgi:DNA-binding beta-propeller fold protein YncE